jgi:tRNA A-37 threonylcarbamoyl transferase component Bud32
LDCRLALPINAILDGNYRIARVVGSGGFAITYEAEDISLGTTVALKEYYPVEFGNRDAKMCVRPKLAKHEQIFQWGRSSFLEEARTLARFEQPSIVRVARVFEANATAYMVMRFEQGPSFETWLTSLGRSPTQAELVSIVVPVLDALEMLHAQNFLHRDIAPDNIIVRADGTPVLLDFGAARRAVAQASHALTGVIKAGYSPFEQYTSNCRLQGPWSDLYALGGTLYRAVSGQAPDEATLRVHDDQMLRAAKVATGDYRPRFLAAIDACLRVRHSERPQSVQQLRSMLLGQSFYEKLAIRRPVAQLSCCPAARQWLASAATALVVFGVGYGGYEYMRSPATAQSALATRAHQRTDTAVIGGSDEQAMARARVQAEARRRQDELAAAESKAAEERARQEAEAKALADAAAAKKKAEELARPRGAFDGEWEVAGLGGERCTAKTWKYRISIENDQILVPDLPAGKVSPAGKFSYKYVAVGWKNVPPGTFTGTLTGDSGAGQYNYSNYCLGSMKLKRL